MAIQSDNFVIMKFRIVVLFIIAYSAQRVPGVAEYTVPG